MNFEELKRLSRKYCPELTESKLNGTDLGVIINNGALEIARKTACLPASATFNVVANQREYNLSSVVTDFLVIRESGLWWYNATRWIELEPKTLKWLDENLPNWRSADAGDPQYYDLSGDLLTIHPTPDTAGTNYFWIYYGKKPAAMTSNSHYPFGFATQIPHLSPYHELILQYVKWKGLYIIGSKDDYSLARKEFMADLLEMKDKLGARPDLENHEEVSMEMDSPFSTFE